MEAVKLYMTVDTPVNADVFMAIRVCGETQSVSPFVFGLMEPY